MAMAADSQPPFPPAETLGVEIPNQQMGSPNSDYFSPRSDDESTELYDSPLTVEDVAEGKGSEAEDGDEVLNCSPRSAFSPDLKCDEVPVNPLESESPLTLNCNDNTALVPNPFLSIEQVQNNRPIIAGAGLGNLGNTCFLNSVLQCFMHTVPLLHGILSDKHSMRLHCTNEEFCVICSFRHLVELSLLSADRIVLPWDFFNSLGYFSSSFQKYQQEDAHEFLQCFLDRFESCDSKWIECMSSHRDNIVKQVFGGRLVSKLKCCSCGHPSDTYEPSIDLSLEIEGADSLLTALQSFTKVEKLEDPETKFTCEKCKEQVSVEKQLSFDQTPLVAAFHLKRFKTDGYLVQKIDKHISFPLDLDLLPFTHSGRKNEEELNYVLYAVVVHIGLTSTSGHYYCFICLAPNVWCKFDDSRVVLVPEDYVLSQEAYILFYAKEGTPWFSVFVETRSIGLRIPIWTTSPKSVLDTATLVSPNLQDKVACDSNEVEDDIATDHKVGKIEIQYTSSARRNAESFESKDNSTPVVPTARDSLDKSGPESQKNVSPLNQRRDASSPRISRDVVEEKPARSPSPDIYREDPPGYSIPRENLKRADRISCKRRLEKDMDDMQKKQACNFVKKTFPSARAQQFLSALSNSKNEAGVSRKRAKKRSGMSDSNTRSVAAGSYR